MLKPHEERVVTELQELTARREKLAAFINTNPLFEKLDVFEQSRMHRQCNIMRDYELILQERIANFPSQTPNTEA